MKKQKLHQYNVCGGTTQDTNLASPDGLGGGDRLNKQRESA